MFLEELFEGMAVSVRLDDGNIVALTEQIEAGSNQNVSVFSDGKKEIDVHVTLKESGNKVFLYVKGQINNLGALKPSRYFSLSDAVTVRIKNREELEELQGIYRHKQWWTRPAFGKQFSDLPEKTQSLLWKEKSNYFYVIPAVSDQYKTDLRGSEKGLELQVTSYAAGYDKVEGLIGVVARGNDPYTLCESVIAETIEELGSKTMSREKRIYPETFDYLGWCSWDAFYTDVNEEGLKEKISELDQMQVPVKWAIIDDGWLKVTDNMLESFEPDASKFPKGFGSVINELKEKYGVKWVGVWHTLMGYWGGIHPDSPLAKEMSEYLYTTTQGRLMPKPEAGKAFEFWNKWYNYLKSEGVDFVKVDGQSAIEYYLHGQMAIGKAATEIHTALEAAVSLHFDKKVINCMGMASENIWSRPASAISRNSDDFVPGDEISFKEHALQNAYNSYFHGKFYWGDWDMFWTKHEEALQNSVLRAVSGGPVYISDRIGETDPQYIWPLILKNGKIIRGEQPGIPTTDCLFVNPNIDKLPLKVWNTVGNSTVVSSFNIHLEDCTISGELSPSHLPQLNKNQDYLVYDYFSQNLQTLKYNDSITLEIEAEGVRLHTLLPLDKPFIPIGLMDKYLAEGAILDTYRLANIVVVKLAQGGIFGFYSKEPVASIQINEENVDFEIRENGLYSVDCSSFSEEVMVMISFEDQ